MDTNKIREALEIASFYKGSHTPASRSASARMTVVMNAEDFEKILSALAELDKAQQPAEPVACDYRRKECANDGAMVNGRWVCNNHATHPPQAQQEGKVLTGEPYAWEWEELVNDGPHRGWHLMRERFNPLDNPYLNREPSSVRNLKALYLAPAAGLTMDGPLYDFKPDGTDVRLSVYPDHNHDGGFYLSWLQGEERWSTKLGWADVMECLANEYAPDDVAMRLQDQMKSARLTAAIQAKR